MIHAHLNGGFICIGYGDLTNIETVPTLVYLPNGWDDDLLYRKYENGVWSVEKFEPTPPPTEPTMEERFTELKESQLILMDVLATMYEDMLAKGTV